MKKIRQSILVAVLLISTTILHAVPAIPTPIVFTQPNGETLTVMLKGDERIHWQESMDGYTLLPNKEGYLTYAQLDNNRDLCSTNFIATDIDKRDIVITSFLNTIEKKLFYSDLQVQIMLQIWEIEDTYYQNQTKGEQDISGHYQMICAFVQFPEKPMIKALEEFDPIFNQLGYTGNNNGSVRDYFKEVSYNNLDLTITLCGIYTAPESEAFYAGNGGSDNAPVLATWLANKVKDEPDIDFRNFDANNDGIVDGFHFIFAGLGKENTGITGDIWSHKFSLTGPVFQNGKRISEYSCSPELRSGTTIASIGTMCHEMTHGLGAADFYDTNYATSGQYTGTGNWDLMANGSYNSNGNRPAHQNMYIKIQFGWVKPVLLNSPTSIKDMPNSVENPVAYRINTTTVNEYYLLENRQKIGFDGSVPGTGLIIYHVSASISGNCINCTHPQRMYPVSASSSYQMPNSTPLSYGSINSSGCTFPGSTKKTSFTDETTPAMWSWANKPSGKPITNIVEENKLVSFDFMAGIGISETNETNKSVIIIPNPANEFIELQVTNYELRVKDIDFYNTFGQLVKSVSFNGEMNENLFTQKISISDLSKGVYFVKIGNETTKLVVQ